MLTFSVKQFQKEAARIREEYGGDARFRLKIHRAGMESVELHSTDLPELEPGEYTVELAAKAPGEKEWTRVFSGKIHRPLHGNSSAARNTLKHSDGGAVNGGASAGNGAAESLVLDRAFAYLEKIEGKFDEAQRIRDSAATASLDMTIQSLKGAFSAALDEIVRAQDRSVDRLRTELDDTIKSYERRFEKLQEEHEDDRRRWQEKSAADNTTPGERMLERGIQLGEKILSNLDKIKMLTGQGVPPTAAASGPARRGPV